MHYFSLAQQLLFLAKKHQTKKTLIIYICQLPIIQFKFDYQRPMRPSAVKNLKEKVGIKRVYAWITNNKFKYPFETLIEAQFKQIITAVQKWILQDFLDSKNTWSLKINKLGTFECFKSKEGSQIYFYSSPSFMGNFSYVKKSEKNLHKQNRRSNLQQQISMPEFTEIGARIYQKPQSIKKTFDSYISACLDMARLETDRLVQIDIGLLKMQILNKKANIKMLKIKQNSQIVKKPLLSRGDDYSVSRQWDLARFNDSLMGCLGEDINVRKIKNNLDSGFALTKKYMKYEQGFTNDIYQ